MSNVLFQTIDQISREKGIDPQIVVHAIEEAIVVASRKYFKSNEDLRGRINPETGEIDVYAIRKVVDSVTNPVQEISLDEARSIKADAQLEEEMEFKKPTVGLGRISAQMAKQVIFQKVREAERESVYAEYHKHVGEVVNCVVKRFENGDMIVELGKTEAKLSKRDQSRLENFSVGDRIRVVITKVEKTTKGPQVMVSRTDPILVQHLFQTEVPEIYDGTVQVRSIAREAGERTKIAVTSRERDVDPVGACVGMKGTRVQSIIRELRGEKIDIIPWNEDVVNFAQNALAPAKITRVSVTSDESAHRPHLDVIVDNDQLSLAIGKRGLNARLAAELIGAKIDIKSEEEVKGEVADALSAMLQEAMAESRAQTNVHDIDEMPAEWADKLDAAGYDDLDSVVNASVDDLTAIEGIDSESAAKILEVARQHEEVEETPYAEEGEGEAVAETEPGEEKPEEAKVE